MATANLLKLKFNAAEALPAQVACDTSTGAGVDYGAAEDRRIVLLIENTAEVSEQVTIAKGSGIQAVADYVFSVPANSKVALVVESGRYKNFSDAMVRIKGSSNVKVTAIATP